ncbi:MAG: WD40 repeat domain-containing protein [candidate division WOR-3 bacterium]
MAIALVILLASCAYFPARHAPADGQGVQWRLPMTLGSAPFARADIITCIDIDSQGGAVAILAGNHGNASLWSFPDGLLIREFATPAFGTTYVRFLACGRVATGHRDGSLRLWHSDTGRLDVMLTGHKAPISHLAADVNGRRAMSIDSTGHCIEWDMKVGAPICSHEIGRIVQPPYSISGDLETVAGVSASGLGIVVWQVAKQKVSIMEDPFNEIVMGVAVDAGGRRVAAGDKNGIVRIWDVPSGRVEYSPGRLVSGLLYSITFDPQGGGIAVGGYPNSAIYKLATKRLVSIKGPPKVSVSAVAFAEGGKWLIAGGSDGLVRIYDGESGARKHSGIGHESAVTAIADGPSSTDIFSAGSFEGSICQWDAERGVLKNLSHVPGSTSAIVLLPKDNLVALGYDDGKVRLALLNSRSVLMEYGFIRSPVLTISLSSQGLSALSGHIDGSIIFAHGADYILVPSERSKYSTVKCSDMSPSGDLAVTGHGDGMIRFWRLPSGALVAEARASTESITAVRLAHAGRICLVGDHKGRISAWNSLVATRILDLGGHDSPVTSIDISPVGDIAASVDKSGSLTLWKIASGGKLTQKSLGKGEITTVKIVNKGRVVAFGMGIGCIELESVGVLARGAMLRRIRLLRRMNWTPCGQSLDQRIPRYRWRRWNGGWKEQATIAYPTWRPEFGPTSLAMTYPAQLKPLGQTG